MKTFYDFDARQKIAQFSVQTIRSIVTAGAVVFLILVWMLTNPLIQLVDQAAGRGKLKTNIKN